MRCQSHGCFVLPLTPANHFATICSPSLFLVATPPVRAYTGPTPAWPIPPCGRFCFPASISALRPSKPCATHHSLHPFLRLSSPGKIVLDILRVLLYRLAYEIHTRATTRTRIRSRIRPPASRRNHTRRSTCTRLASQGLQESAEEAKDSAIRGCLQELSSRSGPARQHIHGVMCSHDKKHGKTRRISAHSEVSRIRG